MKPLTAPKSLVQLPPNVSPNIGESMALMVPSESVLDVVLPAVVVDFDFLDRSLTGNEM